MMTEQIWENLQQTQPVQPIPVEPKKRFDVRLIVILLIIVLLVAGGVYAGMNIGKKPEKDEIVNKGTPSPEFCTSEAMICPDGSSVGRVGPNCEFASCPQTVVSPTLIEDGTATWKTYTNTEYGFELKYPENSVLTPNNQSNRLEFSIKDEGKLSLVVNVRTEYPANQIDSLLDTSSNGEKKAGNTDWKTYSLPKGYCDMGGCSLPIFGLQTEKNNLLYSLLFYGLSSTNNLSDQILSTFKFID